jgi:hypothetical protein
MAMLVSAVKESATLNVGLVVIVANAPSVIDPVLAKALCVLMVTLVPAFRKR